MDTRTYVNEVKEFALKQLPEHMRTPENAQKCVCALCRNCKPWSNNGQRCAQRPECDERRARDGVGRFVKKPHVVKADAVAFVSMGIMV